MKTVPGKIALAASFPKVCLPWKCRPFGLPFSLRTMGLQPNALALALPKAASPLIRSPVLW